MKAFPVNAFVKTLQLPSGYLFEPLPAYRSVGNLYLAAAGLAQVYATYDMLSESTV